MIVAQCTAIAATDAIRCYIENKGQIGDQHGRPNYDVRFLILRAGLNIQLRTNGFSYDSYTVDRRELPRDTMEPWMSSTFHFHRVDVELVGANPRPTITATSPSADYLNYYTHITQQVHGDDGATFVSGYARVTYHDVWPNIDVEWFLDDQDHPEYQFVVRPGGDVTQIQLRYNGANDTRLAGDALELNVKHGTLRERLPRSYVLGSGDLVDVRYRALSPDVYGFTEPPNNIAFDGTLVIDPMPELLWATYYGESGHDESEAVTVTSTGDIVLAGSTQSKSAIATAGAYQDTLSGDRDAYLSLFSSAGVRYWGTYYGGAGEDSGRALAIAPSGDIALMGNTMSSDAISTVGTHQENYRGGYDAYLATFSGSGIRLWATYYGGPYNEFGLALAVAPDGDFLIAGQAFSEVGIASAGAHQELLGGGLRDAFLAKISSTGIRRWGTYYGGNSIDNAWSVVVTPTNTIVLAGETYSTNAIATAGAHQENKDGDDDAFVAVFSSSGTLLWGTYYGGDKRDWIKASAVTPSGDIVLAGCTLSRGGIATMGAHQLFLHGPSDAFVTVLSIEGTRLWGTYLGGTAEDQFYSLDVGPGGEIVLSGNTKSTSYIATAGAHQETYRGGGDDAFVTAFSSSGTRRWGTYYGGDGLDWGTDIVVTPTRKIYLTGMTRSVNSIATAQAHQPVYGGGDMDTYLAVFSMDTTTSVELEKPVRTTHSISSVCPNPASGRTVVTTSGSSDAVLELVDVLGRVHLTAPVAAGTADTNISTAGLPRGSYYVRLVPIDSTSTVQLPTQALIVVQ